jgi:hypothetical protein
MDAQTPKVLAIEEARALDLLFQRLRQARESHTDVDIGTIETEIQSHLREQADLVSALTEIGDEESILLIHDLETRHHEFTDMTESTSGADLNHLPNSRIELEVPCGTEQKDTYQPMDSSDGSRQRGLHNSISNDFCWSLLFTFFICACFATIWNLWLR